MPRFLHSNSVSTLDCGIRFTKSLGIVTCLGRTGRRHKKSRAKGRQRELGRPGRPNNWLRDDNFLRRCSSPAEIKHISVFVSCEKHASHALGSRILSDCGAQNDVGLTVGCLLFRDRSFEQHGLHRVGVHPPHCTCVLHARTGLTRAYAARGFDP